jgi:hypothetical protein
VKVPQVPMAAKVAVDVAVIKALNLNIHLLNNYKNR